MSWRKRLQTGSGSTHRQLDVDIKRMDRLGLMLHMIFYKRRRRPDRGRKEDAGIMAGGGGTENGNE